MKTIKILACLSIAAVVVSCGKNSKSTQTSVDSLTSVVENATEVAASEVSAVKKYPVKSGIITFDNDMMGMQQKSVLYFDDFGMKEAEEKYDGENIKETTLCDGTKRYTIIHKEKAAYDAGNCYRGVAYKFDWDEISKADKEYKVKKQPNRTVAGIDCESYSMESGKFPTIFAGWKNILLYQETKTQYGTVILKAVKVETDIAIPEGKLSVPAGYEVKKGM